MEHVWENDRIWCEDPIWTKQFKTLRRLLKEQYSESAAEGFRIVAGRFTEQNGRDRTPLFRPLFKTESASGRVALRRSLEAVQSRFFSFERFEAEHEVIIRPPRPAFVMIPIIGIETLADRIYRFGNPDRKGICDGLELDETEYQYALRTHQLPYFKLPPVVATSKPFSYWFSYTACATPQQAQQALQVKTKWSDCSVRYTTSTSNVTTLCYVPYNGDRLDLEKGIRAFDGYYHEPLASDHPVDAENNKKTLRGGATQITVYGSPKVDTIEQWQNNKWVIVPFAPLDR